MQLHKHIEFDDSGMQHISALYQQYAPTLYGYLLQHMQAEEDAEDVLVETFLAALESTHFSSMAEKAQLAWLWRVARNKMVDVYRRSSRRSHITLDAVVEGIVDDDIEPEPFALQQEEFEALRIHLQRLSPLQQEVLRLRFFYDMRCSEIAAHLGKREGVVKVMLSRALNILKKFYKN